jgi:hypothetical protein
VYHTASLADTGKLLQNMKINRKLVQALLPTQHHYQEDNNLQQTWPQSISTIRSY